MDFKTVHEAAEILGVSADTIRRWEKKGLVKAVRDGKNHRLFDIGELKRVNAKYLNPEAGENKYAIHRNEKREHTAIELFSGCGGLALGLSNAGFDTRLLVEIDKNCVATLQQNRPDWNIVHGDVKNISFEEHRGKVDLVAGGFPCQAFSYAGNSKGFEDARGTLFFDFARCVKEVMPKVLLAENVRGLTTHDEGKTLKVMLNILKEIGYNVTYRVLKAQFFDVPQKRERLFIIGTRNDLDLKAIFPKERDYILTMRDALQDCPPSAGAKYSARKLEIFDMVPEGGYWRDLPVDVQKEYMGASFYLGGGKTGMARRLAWDEPSLTLTCAPAQKQTERCHPAETRPLNVREYARLQTFPDEWAITGSVCAQYKQIGNAVPVNLAYHVGTCLIQMLDGHTEAIPGSEAVEDDDMQQLNLALC